MTRQLRLTKFGKLDLSNPFFQSLKQDYAADFVDWFHRKKEEDLYVVDDGTVLSGMVYLKREDGTILEIDPPLPDQKWLKVGTFKLERRGTKLGERVIKKVFDTAISEQVDGIYLTVFHVHEQLIQLFEHYGFKRRGTKSTKNGEEIVLVRDLNSFQDDILSDYPFIHRRNKNSWLLAIHPPYHTRLLPDSILNNEPREIVQDVSHTNTIHKVYIAHVSFSRLVRGDAVVFYRTKPEHEKAPARYRSVATSVCVVEEIKMRHDFADVEEFLAYCQPRSVFNEVELRSEWSRRGVLSVAKMTYNAALMKRLTRGALIDEVGIPDGYWNLLNLKDQQFNDILSLGGVDARLIID